MWLPTKTWRALSRPRGCCQGYEDASMIKGTLARPPRSTPTGTLVSWQPFNLLFVRHLLVVLYYKGIGSSHCSEAEGIPTRPARSHQGQDNSCKAIRIPPSPGEIVSLKCNLQSQCSLFYSISVVQVDASEAMKIPQRPGSVQQGCGDSKAILVPQRPE